MSDNKQDSQKQIPSITKGKLLRLLEAVPDSAVIHVETVGTHSDQLTSLIYDEDHHPLVATLCSDYNEQRSPHFNNPVNPLYGYGTVPARPMNLLDTLIDLKARADSFNVMSFDGVNPAGVLSCDISGTDILTKTGGKIKMALTHQVGQEFFEQEVEFDRNLLDKVVMADSSMYFLEKAGTVYVFCTEPFEYMHRIKPAMRGAFTRYLHRRDGVFSVKSVKPEPVKPEPVKLETVKLETVEPEPLLSTIINYIADFQIEIEELVSELEELTVKHEGTRETAIQLVSKHAVLSTLREIYEQAE